VSELVAGVESLHRGLGRLFLTIGVFDGLHRGHTALIERLVEEAGRLGARAGVITFDAHPDAVLVGAAPPLLLDPDERLERLAAAGVEVTVGQHFDDAVRRTTYDDFIRSIGERVDLVGFLMTPDSAFGHQRRGTPEAVAALGEELGYDVVVVPQVQVDGRSISSSEVRHRIESGDVDGAADLLGRPYAIVGDVDAAGRISTPAPVALPPTGRYAATLPDGKDATLEIAHDGAVRAVGVAPGRRRLELARAR
jgi:riboflavin kinase / FMN adenylyltransferase